MTAVWKSMPVEVRAVKTKNMNTTLGQPVADGDDWYEGLTLSVTNVSDKTITYIRGGFIFRPPRHAANAGEPPKYKQFAFGQHHELPEDARPSVLPFHFGPGESIDLLLDRNEHESVKRRLKELGYPDSIKEIQFHLSEVCFDDGSYWAAGHYERKPARPATEVRPPAAASRTNK
ncbi:MAG TPA: hypothetical protein VK421_02570 [Pyrinomonadaceae bacterium]|nr:hypothetical protein [Pyrinomonadaceae bacterium]